MFIHTENCLPSFSQGTGDASCHFRVDVYKDRSFVTLQSVAQPGLCIGMADDGRVIPMADQGEPSTRFFPEVITCAFFHCPSVILFPTKYLVTINSFRHVHSVAMRPCFKMIIMRINIAYVIRILLLWLKCIIKCQVSNTIN